MLKYRILKTLIYSCILLSFVKFFEVYEMKDEIYKLFPEAQAQSEVNNEGTNDAAKNEEDNSVKTENQGLSVDEIKSLSDTEIEILQRLSQSRNKLLKWEEDLKIKENALKITEERIDYKLDQLRELKKAVEKSLSEYRKQEKEKTKSLVKIYENMKPKNAADILSKMKIVELVPLIDKMKEKNAAEIMAKMDPNVAKEVTSRLNSIGRLENPEYDE